jgi:hypothetical protein
MPRCYDSDVAALRWCVVVVLLGGCAGDADEAPEGGSTTSDAPLCEDDFWHGDEGADDTGLGMGDDMPLPITIAELQQGVLYENVWVELTGVVVTTPAADSEVMAGRELFAQDPDGGPFSGLRLVGVEFDPGQIVAPGDGADVVGHVRVNEGFVLLQIDGMEGLTPRGPAAVPAPTRVEIADLAPDSESARRYEGVIVEVVDATVTDDDPCAGEFVLDDTLRVDDRFAPGQLGARAEGDVVTAARGVFVRASESYELAPPRASDVQ